MKLITCLLFSMVCFSLTVFSQTAQDKNINADEIILDKMALILPCPPGAAGSGCPRETIAKVKVNLQNSDGRFAYNYSVSGGRIIGNGREVKWDLTATRPGTYKISVTVNDAQGNKKTLRKSITLAECASCIVDCLFCPTTSITSSVEAIGRSKIVTFVANVSGAGDSEFTFQWKISNGKIFEGQGTPVLKVKASKSAGKDLTVTFIISGTCPDCEKTFTKTIKIISE